jgi:sugar lactone lactonase YvrE
LDGTFDDVHNAILPASASMETLLEGGAFFESPRWHGRRWWFSDFFRGVVVAADELGHVDEIVAVDGRPSGLGWLPDGSLLVVSRQFPTASDASPACSVAMTVAGS